jgi:hypothetical protein
MALRATKIIILFKKQVINEDIKLYRLKIGFLIYLAV